MHARAHCIQCMRDAAMHVVCLYVHLIIMCAPHAGKLILAIMLLKATHRWTTLLFVSNVLLSVTRRYARSNNIAVSHSNLLLDKIAFI